MKIEPAAWAATAVDYGETCDGKARVLGLFGSKGEAAAVKKDMDFWLERNKDEGVEMDCGKLAARYDYDTSAGCEWNVEPVTVPAEIPVKIG